MSALVKESLGTTISTPAVFSWAAWPLRNVCKSLAGTFLVLPPCCCSVTVSTSSVVPLLPPRLLTLRTSTLRLGLLPIIWLIPEMIPALPASTSSVFFLNRRQTNPSLLSCFGMAEYPIALNLRMFIKMKLAKLPDSQTCKMDFQGRGPQEEQCCCKKLFLFPKMLAACSTCWNQNYKTVP